MTGLLTLNTNWTFSRKMWFRFFCCFFFLYTFPFIYVPFIFIATTLSEKIGTIYNSISDVVTIGWHWLIPNVGTRFLHLEKPITIFTNGSGDTTYDYVLLLTQVCLSVLLSIFWGIIDRHRKNYNTLYYWLTVLIRYFLAYSMISYGFSKVFHLQMPYPNLRRLTQPYGNSSPMGIAWTYVGLSKAYSAFTGWSEVLCGLLLFFRRTTLLGALLSLAVMGNVVIINFCFDVPVKLYSSILELMAFYLAWPYLKKLYNFFISGKYESISQQYPNIKTKWLHLTVRIIKWVFVFDCIISNIISSNNSSKEYGDNAPKVPLYGIYTMTKIIKNNDPLIPLMTDTTLWKRFILEFKGRSAVTYINDTSRWYNASVDTVLKKISFYPNWDTINRYNFHYTIDNNHLLLNGSYKNDSLIMDFKRTNEKDFLLMNRGFHWINEYPFNR